VPAKAGKAFGRIKEPLMLTLSVIRGLGCKGVVRDAYNSRYVWQNQQQRAFEAYSVFNFFPPNHRTQGTNVLAPEQKMLNSSEFASRMWSNSVGMQSESNLVDAGCDVSAFKAAAAVSDEKLVELIGERFFRGAMPAVVAKSLIEANKNLWQKDQAMAHAAAMLDMATLTPAFGVSK
jgi:hypothetical protein